MVHKRPEGATELTGGGSGASETGARLKGGGHLKHRRAPYLFCLYNTPNVDGFSGLLAGLRYRRVLQSLEVTSYEGHLREVTLGGGVAFNLKHVNPWDGASEREGCLGTDSIICLCPEGASVFAGRITDWKRLRDVASVS